MPALLVKMVGALALGLIYQFYYSGGDTFNYHTHGSRVIWEAFGDSLDRGIKLLFSGETVYKYSGRILFYGDDPSFFIVQVATILDFFTFSTYSATAILFSVISFIGSWMFFLTFYQQYPQYHFRLAIAAFFIPSVFFWGSGILKDTIALACLGIATYQIFKLFIKGKVSIFSILLLLASCFAIFSIKKFILQAYLPATIIWVIAFHFYKIKSVMLRLLIVPLSMALVVFSTYYTVMKIGEGDKRYALNRIAQTARITAYDIGFYTGRDAGSGYSIGDLDYSFNGLLRVAPSAINVALFRPYFWEVKNLLMVLSAAESLFFLVFVFLIVARQKRHLFNAVFDPNALFCLVFSLSFAFAVGISTFNFGTLARYKIPLLPFLLIALLIIYASPKRDKKVAELDKTE
ncbi:MAG: hypothetical protein HOP37_01460 [Cyclobacteriaceae bacterium]|nr:hypothetical protein [Cyclobacteriaceae bacterium]